METVLITGANAGLGKEAARQLAIGGARKVFLGCRNRAKAESAKAELERETGRAVFQIIDIDVSDLGSVREAVAALPEPVHGVVLNAGGLGGRTPGVLTKDGVTFSFAVNVLGHAALLEALVDSGKLTGVAVLVGAEAARGIPMLRMERPRLVSNSAAEFASIADGSFFDGNFDATQAFILAKYTAVLWMGAMARNNPHLRMVTISPGGSAGSSMSDVPAPMRILATWVVQPLLKALGRFHDLETGAARYLRALEDADLRDGVFWGSPYPGLTGDIVDQSTLFPVLADPDTQDAAYAAVARFLEVEPTASQSRGNA